jgi:RNA polymerase sigma-70 factor (ECF subfamily)
MVRAAQSGDAIAMSDLLDHLGPYVGRICAPIALNDGPDAAQETLITVFRSLRQLRQPAALFGWVRSIAVREAIKVAHRSAATPPTSVPDVTALDDPELGADIADTLEHLSPEHRAVLVLRHVEDLDEAEVSRALSLPEGTVRSRIFRARRAFEKEWGR